MLTAVAGGVAGLMALGLTYEQIARRREQHEPLPGRLVDVGGYRLHITDKGQGGPTVVIIPGAGDTCYSWVHVQEQVAQFTRVVSYDRPGLGASDPGPAPDAAGTVEELHTLLAKAEVPGPYVLVGHSLGGVIARLYAYRYPEQVAGLVMVDSSHENLKDDKGFRMAFKGIRSALVLFRSLSIFGVPRLLGKVLMYPERTALARQVSLGQYRQWSAAVYRNMALDGGVGELGQIFTFLEDSARVAAGQTQTPQFGDLPLAVLTNTGFGENWISMHRELAQRSSNSIHLISDKKGHNLQMLRPDLAVDGIRHVVEQVRHRAAQVS